MLGFRVWYYGHMMQVKNSKVVMNSEGDLCEIYEGGPCPYPINSGLYPSAPIPMQSTGLFDLSHQEIFERDIVKISRPDINHEYSFCIESVPHFYTNLPAFGQSKWEILVLGNEFENPELLERIK